jgi:hypothetical protein
MKKVIKISVLYAVFSFLIHTNLAKAASSVNVDCEVSCINFCQTLNPFFSSFMSFLAQQNDRIEIKAEIDAWVQTVQGSCVDSSIPICQNTEWFSDVRGFINNLAEPNVYQQYAETYLEICGTTPGQTNCTAMCTPSQSTTTQKTQKALQGTQKTSGNQPHPTLQGVKK